MVTNFSVFVYKGFSHAQKIVGHILAIALLVNSLN